METEFDRKIAEQIQRDELKAAAEKKALTEAKKASVSEFYNTDTRSRREELLRKQREMHAHKQLEGGLIFNAIAHLSLWNWLDKDKFWFGLCGLLVIFYCYSFVSHGVIRDVNAYRSQLSASASFGMNAS